jgi:hypothetical protein
LLKKNVAWPHQFFPDIWIFLKFSFITFLQFARTVWGFSECKGINSIW